MNPHSETNAAGESRHNVSSQLFILTALTPIVTIFGVLSYTSGWSFLAHYYDYFGMSLGDADIGLYGVLVHGLTAIQIGMGRFVVICYLAVGFILIFIRAAKRNDRLVSLLAGFTILILIVVSSWLSASAGTTAAEADAGYSSSLPNIVINPDGGDKCRSGKLLRRTDNTYFIVRIQPCKPQSGGGSYISLGIVTVVPSDIVLIDHYMR